MYCCKSACKMIPSLILFMYIVMAVESTSTEEDWNLTRSSTLANEYFGYAVDISGPFIVVGNNGPVNSNSRAYVFEKEESQGVTTYSEVKILEGQSGSNFGRAVAIDGNTIVVGADDYVVGVNYYGAVYMFQYISAQWQEVAVFTGADASFTPSFSGTKTSAPTPAPVPFALNPPTNKFEKILNVPDRRQVQSNVGASNDLFGYSVAVVDEKFIAVGAPGSLQRGMCVRMTLIHYITWC